MDQILLLNPAFTQMEIESLLEQYSARRLGEFTESDEIFSVWELIVSHDAVFEFELHWKRFDNIGYLCLRESPPATLFGWLHQHQLPASVDTILALLGDTSAENRLRGLAMVALNPQPYFVDALFGLCDDSDAQVRQAAQELFEQVFQVKPEQLALPETHVHAPLQDRRQLLRWVMQTTACATQANAAITQLIEQSLKDTDWEVRVSAMIACARFRLVSLAPLIAAAILPSIPVVTRRDLEILHAIQKIVLFILSGKIAEVKPEGIKQARWFKIYELIMGEQPSNSTPVELDCLDAIIHYFTTPFQGHQQPPQSNPAVVSLGEKYFLATTAIELCWVPAGFYWAEIQSSKGAFFYKKKSPGFFISRYHYSQHGECDDELPATELAIRIDALNKTLGVVLCLPTREQWLSAMCGTDARNYAWGWGLQNDWMLYSSPWGLMQSWSDQGEWIRDEGNYRIVGIAGQLIRNEKSLHADSDVRRLPWRVVFAP